MFNDLSLNSAYSAFAKHFSSTRYKRWPVVQQFLDEYALPSTLGVDLGCGNGKNIISDGICIGLDLCPELLHCVPPERAKHLVCSSILATGLRSSIFDYALCIAVLHHLPTEVTRLQALKELGRILYPGSSFLIFVWAAVEVIDGKVLTNKSLIRHFSKDKEHQDEVVNSLIDKQDLIVPWVDMKQGLIHNRFYHVFKKGELERLVEQVPELKIHKSGYDRDNWFCHGVVKQNN